MCLHRGQNGNLCVLPASEFLRNDWINVFSKKCKITLESQKQNTQLLTITSPNVDRFSKILSLLNSAVDLHHNANVSLRYLVKPLRSKTDLIPTKYSDYKHLFGAVFMLHILNYMFHALYLLQLTTFYIL